MKTKFVSFSGSASKSLDRKVNEFFESHPNIEIIETKFSASFGEAYAAFLYRLKQ